MGKLRKLADWWGWGAGVPILVFIYVGLAQMESSTWRFETVSWLIADKVATALLAAWFAFMVANWTHRTWPATKRSDLTDSLLVEVKPEQGGILGVNIVNDGAWSIRDATVSVRVDYTKDDIAGLPEKLKDRSDGHEERWNAKTFNPSERASEPDFGTVAWARHPHPTALNLYSKDKQQVNIFEALGNSFKDDSVNPGKIVVVWQNSEVSQEIEGEKKGRYRVCLKAKDYRGHIKIVSDDTNAKVVPFVLSVSGSKASLLLEPQE